MTHSNKRETHAETQHHIESQNTRIHPFIDFQNPQSPIDSAQVYNVEYPFLFPSSMLVYIVFLFTGRRRRGVSKLGTKMGNQILEAYQNHNNL